MITREDIEASGAANITDLLRMVPGMEVVITTPYTSSISSRLMWTYENNIYLVLIDGREANVEMMGFTPWGKICSRIRWEALAAAAIIKRRYTHICSTQQRPKHRCS